MKIVKCMCQKKITDNEFFVFLSEKYTQEYMGYSIHIEKLSNMFISRDKIKQQNRTLN